MKSLLLQTEVDGHFKDVFSKFDQTLFKALEPPLIGLKICRYDGNQIGDEIHLELELVGLKQQWVSLITDFSNNEFECFFIDEGKQLPPPLSYWRHKHSVKKISESKSMIIDDIKYKCHGGQLVETALYPVMFAQFMARKPIYRKFFAV